MKPFLKWAGNKYSIRHPILDILHSFPSGNRLVEPFVGSGAIFLNTDYSDYLLSDSNEDLIRLYQTLKTYGEDFIHYCATFFIPENNQPDSYYAWRERYNTTDDGMLKSALFVYLNRHCYNGLCRYNRKNQFNVPFGRYEKPYFPANEMLAFYHKAQQAVFRHLDFKETMRQAVPGDVVYCDPPYVPLSSTANFTSYSTCGFSMHEQLQLAKWAEKLRQKGILVLISNHNTSFTQNAYREAKITTLAVRRNISCKGALRGKAPEILALFHSGKLPAASNL